MSAQVRPHLIPEQYLRLERLAETRSEYYNGRMFAMAGGTYNHSRISTNLMGELYNALRGTSYRLIASDLRIRVAPDGLYTYPDLSAFCREPQFADNEKDTLLNPTLIVEVLSPSTEAYDRGFKAAQYRKITSLQEYVLVSQDEARVEVFCRQESGRWLLSEWTGTDATCRFNSIDQSVTLAAIYEGAIWPSSDPPSLRPSPVS